MPTDRHTFALRGIPSRCAGPAAGDSTRVRPPVHRGFNRGRRGPSALVGARPGDGGAMDGVRHVEGEVRELIRRSGLDPARSRALVDRLVRDAVSDYDERSVHGGLPALPDVGAAVKTVMDAVAGYGPLQRYLDDPEVEEIWSTSRARSSSPGVARPS
jgi:hypothetical protein